MVCIVKNIESDLNFLNISCAGIRLRKSGPCPFLEFKPSQKERVTFIILALQMSNIHLNLQSDMARHVLIKLHCRLAHDDHHVVSHVAHQK